MGQCLEQLIKVLELLCSSHVWNIFVPWLFLPGGNWIKRNKRARVFVFEDSKKECS